MHTPKEASESVVQRKTNELEIFLSKNSKNEPQSENHYLSKWTMLQLFNLHLFMQRRSPPSTKVSSKPRNPNIKYALNFPFCKRNQIGITGNNKYTKSDQKKKKIKYLTKQIVYVS